MEQIINMIAAWPQACQFLFFISLSGIVGWSITSIVLEVVKFFNISVPIILHGWPQGVSTDAEEENTDEEKK